MMLAGGYFQRNFSPGFFHLDFSPGWLLLVGSVVAGSFRPLLTTVESIKQRIAECEARESQS
jgi:hypothetical protein